MKNKHTPEIRFPGITGEWKQRKLGEVSERVRGNDGRMDLPTLTISAGSGWLDQRERFSGNIAGKEQKNYTLLSKGELSYNHGNSKLAKYGAVFKLRTYEEALVPRVYHSFKTSEEACPDFIEYMFATKLPDRELSKLISSGARMDGLLNINYEEFMSISITIPKVEEQMEIAKFLRRIDDSISLHQQELTTLKQTKQGFLKKMFPKEGESMPEVRFPGFARDWEKRKLDSMVDRLKSYSLSRDVETNEYTGYKYIHYGDIHTKVAGVIDESSNLPDIKIGNYESLEKGDIVLADASEDYQGIATPAVITIDIPYKLVSGLHTIALRPKSKQVDSLFLYYLFYSPTFRKYGYRTGTGMKVFGISVTNLLKFESMFPLIEEQIEIGKFLKKLDDTIALYQCELEVLKETKKAFLQKMFV
ncbi:restriction endonuclease subunit S [Alkalihalophilus sp. As8PL]|uniref:Restriction endonuclease subunit S n=1 Tax=Alkalihalophilus sp. As8PL TaxID=3237103 RepID=A0AB39BWG7_9BACI